MTAPAGISEDIRFAAHIGRFYDDGDMRLVYLGALHYGGKKPIAYGKDAERTKSPLCSGPDPIVRMEFPSPGSNRNSTSLN